MNAPSLPGHPLVRLRLPDGGGCEVYDASGSALLDRYDSLAEAELVFSGDQLALDDHTAGLGLAEQLTDGCADLAGHGWAIDVWARRVDRLLADGRTPSRADLITALAALVARTHHHQPASEAPQSCPAVDAWGRSTS